MRFQDLRRSSEQKLNETKQRYAQLIAAMRNSESKMDPVLRAFNDQVLFLKHNLNAAAVSSLQTTAAGIDQDVQALIKDMEASINEANAFRSRTPSAELAAQAAATRRSADLQEGLRAVFEKRRAVFSGR